MLHATTVVNDPNRLMHVCEQALRRIKANLTDSDGISPVNSGFAPRAGADMTCSSDPTAIRATTGDRARAFPTRDLGRLEVLASSLQTEVIQQPFTEP